MFQIDKYGSIFFQPALESLEPAPELFQLNIETVNWKILNKIVTDVLLDI